MRRPNLHAGLHQALGRWYLCFALSSGSARRASFWPPHSDFANHHQRPRLSSGLRPAQDEGERSQRGLGRAHADGAARAAQGAGHGAAGCQGGLGQLRRGVGLPQPGRLAGLAERAVTPPAARRRGQRVCPNCAHTTCGTPTQPSRWPQAYIRRSCRKGSATRRSPSRSMSTRTRCPPCKKRRPSAWQRSSPNWFCARP